MTGPEACRYYAAEGPALEPRNGDACPSLIDTPLAAFLADAPLGEIDRATVEAEWARGEKPWFWFP